MLRHVRAPSPPGPHAFLRTAGNTYRRNGARREQRNCSKRRRAIDDVATFSPPRSARGFETTMEERSSRRMRTLVTRMAWLRPIRYRDRTRADIHDGPEQRSNERPD